MKTDQALINNARDAAESFADALNEAADAGLILECQASAGGSQMSGNTLIKQFAWTVRVWGRRVQHY